MLELPILKSKISNELSEVNKVIESALNSEVDPTLSTIYKHLLNSSGKQIRAAIIIFICKSSQLYNKDEVIKLAASIELIHLASLVHDDIIDEADQRRDQVTVHKKFGLNNGILTGVHCYAIALNIIASLNKPRLISIISNAVIKLCEGESIQVNNRYNYKLSRKEYWTIVSHKTSSLFKAAALCTSYLCNLDNDIQEIYSNFGSLLGDIFQLSDDYLDLFDNKNTLNKSIEQDIISGDISLPILLACENIVDPTSDKIKSQLLEQKNEISKSIANEIFDRKNRLQNLLSSIESNCNNDVTDLYKITDIITDRINSN